MWLTFTWIRFLIVLCKVQLQLGYNADDFVTVTMTHSPTVPVQLCKQFNFTCGLNTSNTLDPRGDHSLVVYLQNYNNKIQKSCTEGSLGNEEWGAGVYTILLTNNLTYKKTSKIGGDHDEINAGIIHMSHKYRNFTFTIYKVRKPQEGDNFLCFTCQLQATMAGEGSEYKVNHKTVELKVNKTGDDAKCKETPDKCHLPSSHENASFSYQRNISSKECANCTCQKTRRQPQNTSLFKCVITPCPTLPPPTTSAVITTTIIENTTAAAPTTETPKEPDYTMYYILVGLVVGVALVLGGSYFLYKRFIASTNTDSTETSSSIPIKYSSRRQSGISRASRQSGTSRASRKSGFPRASRQSRFSRASRQSEFSRQSPQPQPTTYVVKQVQQRLVY